MFSRKSTCSEPFPLVMSSIQAKKSNLELLKQIDIKLHIIICHQSARRTINGYQITSNYKKVLLQNSCGTYVIFFLTQNSKRTGRRQDKTEKGNSKAYFK